MHNEYLDQFKQQNLRQCQLKQLAILETIDAICRENNLEYWLDGGTLLGAVRHKGFIPWDDDIDIAMTLDTLERFKRIVPPLLPPHLRMQMPEEEPVNKQIVKIFDLNSFYVEPSDDFESDYQKCVYIDIFPFIPYPNVSRRFVRRFVKQYCRSHAILTKKHYYSWRSVAELLFFGAKYLINKVICHAAFALLKGDKYYGNTLLNNGYGIMHERRNLRPLTTVEFEGRQFPAPADTDAYLRDLYRDYMTIPPKEKQIIHSVFIQPQLVTTDK